MKVEVVKVEVPAAGRWRMAAARVVVMVAVPVAVRAVAARVAVVTVAARAAVARGMAMEV